MAARSGAYTTNMATHAAKHSHGRDRHGAPSQPGTGLALHQFPIRSGDQDGEEKEGSLQHFRKSICRRSRQRGDCKKSDTDNTHCKQGGSELAGQGPQSFGRGTRESEPKLPANRSADQLTILCRAVRIGPSKWSNVTRHRSSLLLSCCVVKELG